MSFPVRDDRTPWIFPSLRAQLWALRRHWWLLSCFQLPQGIPGRSGHHIEGAQEVEAAHVMACLRPPSLYRVALGSCLLLSLPGPGAEHCPLLQESFVTFYPLLSLGSKLNAFNEENSDMAQYINQYSQVLTSSHQVTLPLQCSATPWPLSGNPETPSSRAFQTRSVSRHPRQVVAPPWTRAPGQTSGSHRWLFSILLILPFMSVLKQCTFSCTPSPTSGDLCLCRISTCT
jgi:hypothetical protein